MSKKIKAAGNMRRTLLATSLASCFGLAAPAALAQTSIGNNANLPPGPIAGENWVLDGNAFINGTITVPTQTGTTQALTITSASPGPSKITLISPLTLTSHAFSSGTSSIWIHTVGDVVFDGTSAPNTTPENGSLIFNSATAANGGSIYLGTTGGNVTVTNFVTNGATADTAKGGAIYSSFGAIVIGNNNGIVTLSNNTTNSVAAAVYTADNNVDGEDQTISIYGKTITIEGNKADLHSGAIYTRAGDITIGTASTETIQVRNNTAKGSGGAIQAAGNKVTIDGKTITMTGNSVTATEGLSSGSGGVIMGSMGVEIGNANSIVTITGNSAVGKGGAIFASNKGTPDLEPGKGTVTIRGREITLSNNSAGSATVYAPGYRGGGAIYANANINLFGDKITLSKNTAVNGSGGALEAERNITIIGSMRAEGNTAPSYGGAMWSGGDVRLDATTGNIEFYNNTAGGDGGAIRAGGNVTLNAINGDIIFKGNTAGGKGDAIWFQNSYLSTPSNATVTFYANAGRTITFFDSIANNANPPIAPVPSPGTPPPGPDLLLPVNKTGAGAVVFDGADGEIYGTTTVQGGAFVVRNGAAYGVDIGTYSSDASFMVNAGATLAGGIKGEVKADKFTLLGTLDISGSSLKLPGHPAAGNISGKYSRLTLTSGNINFGSNSQILFNTNLNDASTQLTDVLELDLGAGGPPTGTAKILINNTGKGAKETLGDGIMIVETKGNNTSDDAFKLGARAVAGPYEYKLYRGNAAGSSDDNWYLRAESGYRDETTTYTALPPMALLYGLNHLDTLHERVGEEEDIRGRTDLHQKGTETGGWGRVISVHGKNKGHSRGIYKNNPKYDYGSIGFQLGHDLHRVEKDDGTRNHLGVYFAYGYTEGEATHVDSNARGANDFHAFSLGGYWTHFGETAWYVDTVLQATYYDMYSTLKAPGSTMLSTDGIGFAASVEGGKPFRFNKGYFIEPQAQLTFQSIHINDARDAGGTVRFSNVDSLVGRVGARFGRSWTQEDEKKITLWIRPNVWHEFRGRTVTKFDSADGPVPLRADLGGTWGEINLGVSAQVSRSTSVFANTSYDRRFDNKGYSYNGKLGVRVYW